MLIFYRMTDMTHENNSWKMSPIGGLANFFSCGPPNLHWCRRSCYWCCIPPNYWFHSYLKYPTSFSFWGVSHKYLINFPHTTHLQVWFHWCISWTCRLSMKLLLLYIFFPDFIALLIVIGWPKKGSSSFFLKSCNANCSFWHCTNLRPALILSH